MVEFRVKKYIIQMDIKQWSLENWTSQSDYDTVKSSYLHPRLQTQVRLHVIEAKENTRDETRRNIAVKILPLI